jgi:alpha-galactosidase
MRAVLAIVCLAIAVPSAAADRAATIAQDGDAFVAHEDGTDAWSIGSTNLEVVIGLDASHALAVQRIWNPSTGRSWNISPGPDAAITIDGRPTTVGAAEGFTFAGVAAQTRAHGVLLTFTFEDRGRRLSVERSYAAYPGSPTIECWTRIESLGGSADLSGLTAWQMTMPLGTVRWLNGLRGDSADTDAASAFSLDKGELDPGDQFAIGSDRQSTEQYVPLLFVEDGDDSFYGGLMWSAAWRIAVRRVDDRLSVEATFPNVVTNVGPRRAVELPHAFFGVTDRAVADESGALHEFVMNGIRRGRRFQPLVTYNTWYSYGVTINEDAMVAEIDRAAALGVELFVVDAGWWAGAGENGDFDFASGLGSWDEDRDRFPASLASLADYTHDHGMKFGLWVEPGRVAMSTVDRAGLAREPWLATEGGDYGAADMAQICFTRADAREWVTSKLFALIDRVRPDYLKWDSNLWVNCDRGGHGHGNFDGPFTHMQALYGILGELRDRYPALLIENVSGGGNRLDFGMLAYTDTAWMDDRTSPSSHVRHNIEGLTFAFPPGYLFSFAKDDEEETIVAGNQLSWIVRSRMPGVLGLSYRSDTLGDDTAAELADEIARYKTIRSIVADANATLLTAQAPLTADGWDVLQEVTVDATAAVVFAFKDADDPGSHRVRPRALLADTIYDVESFDAGPMGSATGAALMRDGIEVMHAGGSRAHVVVLRASAR